MVFVKPLLVCPLFGVYEILRSVTEQNKCVKLCYNRLFTSSPMQYLWVITIFQDIARYYFCIHILFT